MDSVVKQLEEDGKERLEDNHKLTIFLQEVVVGNTNIDIHELL